MAKLKMQWLVHDCCLFLVFIVSGCMLWKKCTDFHWAALFHPFSNVWVIFKCTCVFLFDSLSSTLFVSCTKCFALLLFSTTFDCLAFISFPASVYLSFCLYSILRSVFSFVSFSFFLSLSQYPHTNPNSNWKTHTHTHKFVIVYFFSV